METDHQHVEDGGTNSPLVSMDVSTLRVSPLGWGEGAAGSSSPPAGRTCFGCFTAKVKCEKTTPCKRCVRLGKECVPNPRKPGRPSKLSQSHPSPPIPPQSTGNHQHDPMQIPAAAHALPNLPPPATLSSTSSPMLQAVGTALSRPPVSDQQRAMMMCATTMGDIPQQQQQYQFPPPPQQDPRTLLYTGGPRDFNPLNSLITTYPGNPPSGMVSRLYAAQTVPSSSMPQPPPPQPPPLAAAVSSSIASSGSSSSMPMSAPEHWGLLGETDGMQVVYNSSNSSSNSSNSSNDNNPAGNSMLHQQPLYQQEPVRPQPMRATNKISVVPSGQDPFRIFRDQQPMGAPAAPPMTAVPTPQQQAAMSSPLVTRVSAAAMLGQVMMDKARSVLMAWQCWKKILGRDPSNGMRAALLHTLKFNSDEALNSDPGTAPATNSGGEAASGMEQFVSALRSLKSDRAFCIVKWTGGKLKVICSERFSSVFIHKDLVEIDIIQGVAPHDIWARLFKSEASKTAYWDLITEATFLNEPARGPSWRHVEVEDRFNVVYGETCTVGVLASPCGWYYCTWFVLQPCRPSAGGGGGSKRMDAMMS